jgi:1,4-alpha-glucan branching enzyme
MWAHPGKKLLFMGGEIAQWHEWNYRAELDWFLLAEPDHQGMQRLVRDLNHLYRREPALYELDDEPAGFRWIDLNDAPHSVISFVRFPSFLAPRGRRGRVARNKGVHVVVVCNFTPIPRERYRIGVPRRCAYLEVLNTDAAMYGGSGMGNLGRVEIEDIAWHGFAQSIVLTLPPLATVWFVPELEEDPHSSLEPDSNGGLLVSMATGDEAGAASPAARGQVGGHPQAPEADAEQQRIDRSIAEESTLVSFDRPRPK